MASPNQVTDRLRALCLALPETRETAAWGHPNFCAGKKTFVCFERIDDRPSLAFRLDRSDVDRLLLRADCFVAPYGRGQWVGMWADGPLDWRLVADLVEKSYRLVALKRMLAALDEGRARAHPPDSSSFQTDDP